MELTSGWCKWMVTEDYLTTALTQLTKHGVRSETIKFLNKIDTRTCNITQFYIILYYNDPE
jgi:hypothetical protein